MKIKGDTDIANAVDMANADLPLSQASNILATLLQRGIPAWSLECLRSGLDTSVDLGNLTGRDLVQLKIRHPPRRHRIVREIEVDFFNLQVNDK
mmetsp:Transcript_85677/g.245891  ORF Transcript_85677/g.245891 Transcript_85677/m.245891 type:complete len:94 (+) Transcript_85677:100-381(+)|eukprot:CAMPEP_0177203422 /NCGR_PEP_ID=MMETSP0367-20130122/27808_1 /TAXON_ID=447022 ORGANISM="Scrippsiella hangoei-like, Strain SHHI-4" /NCGR_SAMPLE_ID=MMETSP0367 /ASSEMBLY_ACC=CAM_ASM_000362 /LENGTH=93 /DNA_ID=CAMNT_0018652055 /DNA_START=78 /DNA_END=359 /DNA_ORIENTATION=+